MDNNTPEKRCCDECGHAGTDGGSDSESYCGACGRTVSYPAEDLCPECGATNCMLIACPECGGRYSLDEERGDDIETPNAELRGSEPIGGASHTNAVLGAAVPPAPTFDKGDKT